MNATEICEQGVKAGVLKRRFEQFGEGPAKVLGRVYEETEAFGEPDEELQNRYRKAMAEVRHEYEERASKLKDTKIILAVTQGLDMRKKSS